MGEEEIIEKLKQMQELLDNQEVPRPHYLAVHLDSPWYNMMRDKGWEEVEPGLFKVPPE